MRKAGFVDNNFKGKTNKKNFLVTISILLLQTLLFGSVVEDYVLEENTYILTGAIDDKYPITMYFTIDNENNVSGKYYYDKMKKYIYINGKANGDNIKLEEEIDNNITGEFSGKFDKKNIKYSGTWINAKTKKSMPFSLVKNEIYAVNHIEMYEYSYESNKVGYTKIYPKLINYRKLGGINNINKMFEVNDIDLLYDKYDEIYENDSDNPYGFYSFEETVKFEYIDENIISFTSWDYWYFQGAAHPNRESSSMIINLKTGKQLNKSIDDLIININDKDLISLVRQKIKEYFAYNVGDSDANVQDYYFDFDEIRLNDNYYINAEGIHFIYDPYEIASYAFGETYLSFSFDELKPYVKRSSPFYYLFE